MGEPRAVTDVMRLHTPDGLPVQATWIYQPNDPLAVTVEFDVDPNQTIAWTFARDLLAGGLHRRAGVGDVVVFPARAIGYPGRTALVLRSPGEGEVVLLAATTALARFVGRTMAWVPAGGEGPRLNVDRVIARIFAETGAA